VIIKRERGMISEAESLGFCPEIHVPPGGTGPAARRHRRGSESAWLQAVMLVLGYFDV